MYSTNSNLPITSTTVVNNDPPTQPAQPSAANDATPVIGNRSAPADPRGQGDSATDFASSPPRVEVRYFPDDSEKDDPVVVIGGNQPAMEGPVLVLQDALVDADLDRLKALLADQPALVNEPLGLLKCTPLVAAIEMKRPDFVDYLLSLPEININARGSSRQTALHAACAGGEVALAKRLLRCGAKVNTCDGQSTPLIAACKHGDPALLKHILKRTSMALLDFRLPNGHTAMTAAIDAGQLSAVKLLLRKGANPNLQSLSGMTPLHHAAKHGHTQIAKLLFRYGATQQWTKAGMPANLTCSGNHAATLAYLLKKTSKDQKPFSEMWMSHAMMESVANDATACVKILLAAGVGMLPETGGFSLLMGIILLDRPRSVEVLLNHGADVNYQTLTGNSALSIAVIHDVSMDVLLILLSAMGKRITLAHDVALRLVQRAQEAQDFRILNELTTRRIEDHQGQPFDLKKALN